MYIPDWLHVVRAHHDVVHVPDESANHHHQDVNDDETDKRTHHEKMERAADLPIPRQLRVPWKTRRQRRRHRRPRRDCQRRQDEHHHKIGQLLQRVVLVEAIRLRRHVQGGVVNKHRPGVWDDVPRVRHQAPPLRREHQQNHEATPLPIQNKTLRKCQCRAMPMVCR